MTKLEALDAACAYARELVIKGFLPDIIVVEDCVHVGGCGAGGHRKSFKYKEA